MGSDVEMNQQKRFVTTLPSVSFEAQTNPSNLYGGLIRQEFCFSKDAVEYDSSFLLRECSAFMKVHFVPLHYQSLSIPTFEASETR